LTFSTHAALDCGRVAKICQETQYEYRWHRRAVEFVNREVFQVIVTFFAPSVLDKPDKLVYLLYKL
jgi:hypothetical protein